MRLAFLILLIVASSANCSPLAKKPPTGASSVNPEQSQGGSATIRQADDVSHRWPVEFRQAGLSGVLESNDGEIKQEGSTFKLKFWRSELGTLEEGPYVPPTSLDYTVCVKPWMIMPNGMQHGSMDESPIGIQLDEQSGTYTVNPIFFIMDGTSQFFIELCNGNVRCPRNGYTGCPAGQLYEHAMVSFEVH